MTSHSLLGALGAALLFTTSVVADIDAAAQARLDAALAAQTAEVQARYGARHPGETLAFFGIEPGMTVYEALPGGGWYSRILLDYLGADGKLVGIDYAYAMYPMFNFYDEDYLEAKKSWVESWPAQALGWRDDDDATVGAFLFGSMPEALAGQADAVLLVRALHNLARFEDEGGYLTTALQDIHRALKPGGVVGVVQHRAPEDADDAWADGSNGYLKRSFVVARFEQAGFELVAESDINRNPADQPGPDDYVWRLPPALHLNDANAARRAEYEAIGESDRMTLLFRKR
jgi:predicted methyltransferase